MNTFSLCSHQKLYVAIVSDISSPAKECCPSYGLTTLWSYAFYSYAIHIFALCNDNCFYPCLLDNLHSVFERQLSAGLLLLSCLGDLSFRIKWRVFSYLIPEWLVDAHFESLHSSSKTTWYKVLRTDVPLSFQEFTMMYRAPVSDKKLPILFC